MKPLLTIAIPTFNRADRLKRCLEACLEQTAGKSVELLVSDNASEDATQAFMTEFCKKNLAVSYVRNPENIGPDRNFLNCYNCAKGEYVLLLGDDDVLLPGAVDAILEALSRKPVMVYINTSDIKNQDPLVYTEPRNPEGDMQIMNDPVQMLDTMGIFVTFMSSFILRNDLVQAVEDKEQYIGTYFIQSHIALHVMCAGGELIFVRKNCLAASGNDTVTYDVYKVWGEMYGKLLNETAVAAGIDPLQARKLHEKDLRGLIAWFVKTYRRSCDHSQNWDKKSMLDQVKPYPGLYLKYWAFINLPLPLVQFIRDFKSFFRRRENS